MALNTCTAGETFTLVVDTVIEYLPTANFNPYVITKIGAPAGSQLADMRFAIQGEKEEAFTDRIDLSNK